MVDKDRLHKLVLSRMKLGNRVRLRIALAPHAQLLSTGESAEKELGVRVEKAVGTGRTAPLPVLSITSQTSHPRSHLVSGFSYITPVGDDMGNRRTKEPQRFFEQ